MGGVLLLPPLQVRLAAAAGPIGNWADGKLATEQTNGLAGQFWIGVLLGAIWSPCVGPTLGAASLLAAQGKDLGQVALTMFAFGIGAALPLLGLGWLSRETLVRWRGTLLSAGSGLKSALALLFVVIGVVIISVRIRRLKLSLSRHRHNGLLILRPRSSGAGRISPAAITRSATTAARGNSGRRDAGNLSCAISTP